jgi:hypothetical protein
MDESFYDVDVNFLEHAHLFGTKEQWRFYFSLISLLLFFGMLYSAILVLIIRAGILILQKKSLPGRWIKRDMIIAQISSKASFTFFVGLAPFPTNSD